jgi:hypothetical protein
VRKALVRLPLLVGVLLASSRKVTIYLKGQPYPYTWCNWRTA